MNKTLFPTIATERRYFIAYVAIASMIVILIVFIQCYRFEIFKTSLLLGWDSPGYVWMAKYVIAKGPINMAYAWSYPNLYSQLLAFFGYLTGNLVATERVLPLLFYTLLIYASSELIYRITKHVHIAGLAAILTALSVNVLRIFSDLHRNLMALSLSFAVLLLVPKLDEEKTVLNKKLLFFISILFIVASTHFETYFVLALALVLYGVLTKNFKKLIILTSSCAIPIAILVSLFPAYFFNYIGTVVFFEGGLPANEILLWSGGSLGLLGFLIIGNFFFYKSKLRDDKHVLLVFSWYFAILLVIALISLRLAPFPIEFARRALLLTPVPILLSLATSGFNDLLKRRLLSQSLHKLSSAKKKRSIFILSTSAIALFVTISSALVVAQYANGFLTPFIPHSGYEKIMRAKEYFAGKSWPTPVFIFRGDPSVWYVQIYRNYLGVEIGEHFAYYGEIGNLLRLSPSEPKIKYDFWLSQLEKYYITFYFDELIGNISGPPPVMYVHDSHVTNVEELMSHPIVLVAPEFYNERIPYYLKSFHKGDGIYVIPPNSSINPSEIAYGPEVTVIKNGTSTRVKSEYSYIDPYNPSIAYIKVNASSGHTSYNFTDIPSNWTFQRIEQDNNLSFPETTPRRINGTKAYSGNDPADSTEYWILPISGQNGTLQIDTFSKMEGFSSLKVSGKTDSFGNLAVIYDNLGIWNLAGYSSINVWVKCNESALFSLTLVDHYGGSRTFWAIEAGGSSVTTSWKRFAVNLTEYTSQTPDFTISSIDHINLFVYATAGKNLSFWIDDLTVDTTLNLHSFVYKDRVPVDETMVAYFYIHTEEVQ